jgi:hypothetical protein
MAAQGGVYAIRWGEIVEMGVDMADYGVIVHYNT